MDQAAIIDIFGRAIYIALLIVTVIIIPGFLAGLVISVFQAATQINEASLSFIPRLLITFLVLSLTGPWLLNILIDYAQSLFIDMPYLIG